jgi:twitching motility two-component system response regulator PilG
MISPGQEGEQDQEMTSGQGITVLVLDDNPLVLKLTKAILSAEGCNVLTASSWIEFNHVLASSKPDIIFLDVNLPSIKGDQLSTALKSQANRSTIPIILISDLPEGRLEGLMPESGADAWLRKPLTRDKLLDTIRRFVP